MENYTFIDLSIIALDYYSLIPIFPIIPKLFTLVAYTPKHARMGGDGVIYRLKEVKVLMFL